MRTFIIRGAMVTFFAVTGLFGSAATVQFDGMSASVDANTASANPPLVCVYKPFMMGECIKWADDGGLIP